MKKGTSEGMDELEEAIKEGKTMEETRKLNNFTAGLFVNNTLQTLVSNLRAESRNDVPSYEEWFDEVPIEESPHYWKLPWKQIEEDLKAIIKRPKKKKWHLC